MKAKELAVSRQLEVVVEHLLNYLEHSDWKPLHDLGRQANRWNGLPLSYFREIEPEENEHTESIFRPLIRTGDGLEDWSFRRAWFADQLLDPSLLDENGVLPVEAGLSFDRIHPRDVDGRWDISTLDLPPSAKEMRDLPQDLKEMWSKEGVVSRVQRYRSVDLSELRKLPAKFRLYTPIHSELSMAFIYRDHSYVSGRLIYGRIDGRWHQVFPIEPGARPEYNDDAHWKMQQAIGMQFTRQFEWRVVLGGKRNSISLTTDPIGARAMFGLRDIPPGRDRREALLHWVREHWRQRRSDPSEEIKVRQHIRGVERFTWSDLNCKIVPAPDDVATVERLRREREAEKQAGKTTRRKRVA